MDEREEYVSRGPAHTLELLKDVVQKHCMEGRPDLVREVLRAMRRLRKLSLRDEEVQAVYSSAVTTILFAYAKAGNKAKYEELLQEIQADKDTRGEPLFDIATLRRTISRM